MADIELSYGRGEVSLDLGEIDLLRTVEPAPRGVPSRDDLRRLLRRPTAGPPLEELGGGRGRATVVIPDRTRGRRLASYLPVVVQELRRKGRSSNDIIILVATGMHRPAGRAELAELVGPARNMVGEVRQHSVWEEGSLLALGHSSRGTPLTLAREVVEAEALVLTGYLGFHYFAGFSGGRKSVLPGVSGLDTITANHCLALDLTRADGLHPRARNGELAGNPVHEDMLESLAHVAPAFMVNLLAAGDEAGLGAVAGEPVPAHELGCRAVRCAAGCALSEEADLAVVSAGGHPHDIDLVQSHKALEASYAAVREGGTVLLVAECSEGVGSESLRTWATRGGVEEMRECLREGFELHAHTALSLRRKTGSRRVVMLSRMDPDLVRRMGMIPAATPEEASRLACEALPSPPTVYVFPRGNITAVVGEGGRRGCRGS